jgi:hypothetical protein
VPLTPKQWIEKVTRAVSAQDWGLLTDLQVEVNHSFARRRDWDGLEQFYTDALIGAVTPDIVHIMKSRDTGTFQAGVGGVLRQALERAAKDPSIKAVCFVYFYDGGEECTGDVFLCTDYQEDDDDWASSFENDGYIGGPGVHEYLSYDPDLKFAPLPFSVCQYYADAMLLAAWGREVTKLQTQLPMGFAEHDSPVIRVTPK